MSCRSHQTLVLLGTLLMPWGGAENLCSRSCSTYLNGASAASMYVCLDSSSGRCGDESNCPQRVGISRCRQSNGEGVCAGASPGCWSAPALPQFSGRQGIAYRTITYGKYYMGSCNDAAHANTFTVFHGESITVPQKTIIEIHGGALNDGSMKAVPNDQIKAYVREGFTYISLDYRLVNNKYFFRDCGGQEREEEYVAVSLDGTMSIPDEKLPLSNYEVRVGGQEFMTKSLYDAAKAMDYITSLASQLMVDTNIVGFIASSAGVALANYLIWTYPRLYPGKYTPVSATFRQAQLEFTVHNMLDQTYGLFVEELGESALLKDYLIETDCHRVVGNAACPASSDDQVNLCNASWHNDSMTSFCGTSFEQTTFGRLLHSQVWPIETEQDQGLAYIWHASAQMRLHQPADLVLYVLNMQGGANGLKNSHAMAHHALYSKKYGDLCVELGVDCVIYYSPWLGIRDSSRGIAVDGLDLKETFSWRESPFGLAASPATSEEMLQIHLYASERSKDDSNFYVEGCNTYWMFQVAILIVVSIDQHHSAAF